MCIVIDTKRLAKVLDPRNAEHRRFAPVRGWLYVGKGCMIYGGTNYLSELGRMCRYLKSLAELERKGRLILVSKQCVDDIADKIKKKVSDDAFNDEHLVAIVMVSRCRAVCTDDRGAMLYLKRTNFYVDYHMKRPKIYHHENNNELCCDRNLVEICKRSA